MTTHYDKAPLGAWTWTVSERDDVFSIFRKGTATDPYAPCQHCGRHTDEVFQVPAPAGGIDGPALDQVCDVLNSYEDATGNYIQGEGV